MNFNLFQSSVTSETEDI